ncbi:hypothetical protein IH979_02570 [Patescibacteria group bacterium]|nr:hypothetical protein [Patescibacteria group bacterium]
MNEEKEFRIELVLERLLHVRHGQFDGLPRDVPFHVSTSSIYSFVFDALLSGQLGMRLEGNELITLGGGPSMTVDNALIFLRCILEADPVFASLLVNLEDQEDQNDPIFLFKEPDPLTRNDLIAAGEQLLERKRTTDDADWHTSMNLERDIIKELIAQIPT